MRPSSYTTLLDATNHKRVVPPRRLPGSWQCRSKGPRSSLGGVPVHRGCAMAFKNPSPVTESTLEVRLTTTMTGGVSLAIWMAVVTREINLLAQASHWHRARGTFSTHGQLTKESAASVKPYAELSDPLDMVVDVEILSGTSARGINGALLASSRVTRSDLGGLRDRWLDLGAFCSLYGER
jgi:hypothetical protein